MSSTLSKQYAVRAISGSMSMSSVSGLRLQSAIGNICEHRGNDRVAFAACHTYSFVSSSIRDLFKATSPCLGSVCTHAIRRGLDELEAAVPLMMSESRSRGERIRTEVECASRLGCEPGRRVQVTAASVPCGRGSAHAALSLASAMMAASLERTSSEGPNLGKSKGSLFASVIVECIADQHQKSRVSTSSHGFTCHRSSIARRHSGDNFNYLLYSSLALRARSSRQHPLQ